MFSFKLRGAYNKMVNLPAAARRRGVIAASAGNHAQGVALAAQRLGCRAVIVMPATTPEVKIQAVRALGAEVELHGDSYSDAYAPGAGPAAQAEADLRAPVRRSRRHRRAGDGGHGDPAPAPPAGARPAARHLRRHRRRRPDRRRGRLREGAAPGDQGHRRADHRLATPWRARWRPGAGCSWRRWGCSPTPPRSGWSARRRSACAEQYVDEVITVDTDALCAAIKDVFQETRSILEPAGALGVAGAKAVRRPARC